MAIIQQILAGNYAASGGSYEAEATALFARFGTDPGTTRKGHINTCIASLKSAGVWSKLDALYVFAAHNSSDALLNWVSSSYNMVVEGSPTFTTDVGYSCATSSNYLKSNYNVDTLTLFTQNSAHISLWQRNNIVGNFRFKTEASGVNIYPRYSDDNTYIRVNDASESGAIAASTDSIGFWLGNRSSSTAREAYKNGSSLGTYGSVASQAVAPEKFLIQSDTSDAMEVAVMSVGGSLTSGEVTSFYNALNTLKSAIGW